MRERLTFEFPTPERAERFMRDIEPEAMRSHRVVDVACRSYADERKVRELAGPLGGIEGTPERTYCNDGATREPWTLADFAEANAEDPEVDRWLEGLSALAVGHETRVEFHMVRRLT